MKDRFPAVAIRGQYGLVMKAVRLVTDAIGGFESVTGNRPIVVALDGYSGAGKSTLATGLAHAVDAAVVHVDDFYRDMPEAERLEVACSGR